MADSKRLDLMQAVEAALNVSSVDRSSEVTTKPTDLTVLREPTRPINEADAPAMFIVYGGEDVSDRATDEASRAVAVDVTVMAKATDSQRADEALDPLLVWAELALMDGYTISGAAAFIRLDRITRLDLSEHASLFVGATLSFEIQLLTKWGDPRQAP